MKTFKTCLCPDSHTAITNPLLALYAVVTYVVVVVVVVVIDILVFNGALVPQGLVDIHEDIAVSLVTSAPVKTNNNKTSRQKLQLT